ncbi:MAG: Various polyols transporter, periplasmic substrate-binding protein [Acidimicrobiaceae bacterium]|nr:Various polyols transporter, periplasmic substrate-binding protein [Acidimicrobiaceae bacterium]
MNRNCRRAVPIAGAALISTLLAVPGVASATSSHASSQSITIWTTTGVNYDWQKTLLPAFEKTTGIHVNYDIIPESSLSDKLQTAELAHSTAYSIIEETQGQTATYKANDGAIALKKFLNNSSLTPASYNFNGISSGSYSGCELKGVVYCLPTSFDAGPELFWNKALFKAAGLTSAPANWNQIVADAKKLTSSSSGVSGICMRGSESQANNYPFFLMFPYFAPYAKNYQGEILNHSWQPLFNSAGAATWAKDYSALMQDYAPKGVSSYGYTDCEHAFETGQVAMWWDDSAFETDLANPKVSKVAKQTGFAEIPCPSFNQTCLLSVPWGMYVNPNLTNAQQDAAWKYMEYVTAPANQITAMVKTANPGIASRTASITYALSHNSIFKAPTDYLQAVKYSLSHIEGNAIPSSPAFSPMVNDINVMLSDLTTGQESPESALSTIQGQITAISAQYHLK